MVTWSIVLLVAAASAPQKAICQPENNSIDLTGSDTDTSTKVDAAHAAEEMAPVGAKVKEGHFEAGVAPPWQ